MVKLISKNGEVEIPDEVFPKWLESLMQIDALLTDDAREELFNGATLNNLKKAWESGEKKYELSDDEAELILTLIQMRW